MNSVSIKVGAGVVLAALCGQARNGDDHHLHPGRRAGVGQKPGDAAFLGRVQHIGEIRPELVELLMRQLAEAAR